MFIIEDKIKELLTVLKSLFLTYLRIIIIANFEIINWSNEDIKSIHDEKDLLTLTAHKRAYSEIKITLNIKK